MDNTIQLRCLKSIIGKILKSLIININFESWKYCIICRHRLFGQTTKQPLNKFEPQKPWKNKQFLGLSPPSSLEENKCNKDKSWTT